MRPATGPPAPTALTGVFGTGLPVPSALLATAGGRHAALIDGPLRKSGDAFDAMLPYNRATAEAPEFVRFTPQYPGADGKLSNLAYCIYRFNLTGYTGATEFAPQWHVAPSDGQTFLGLSNFTTDSWDWLALPPAAVAPFSAQAAHMAGDGTVFAVVAVTGSDAVVLAGLRLGNSAPDAVYTMDASTGPPGLTVHFDASASTDPDGAIAKYQWDPNGDGTFIVNLLFPNGLPNVTCTYSQPGVYHPTVRVIDDLGATDTYSSTITVSLGALTTVVLDGTGSLPDPDFASLVLANAKPLIVYSTDYQLKFVRATTTSGEVWTAPANIASATGDHLDTAVISGNPAAAFRTTGSDIGFVRASDADGTSWFSPTVALNDPVDGIGFGLSLLEVAGRPAVAYGDNCQVAGGEIFFARCSDSVGVNWPTPQRLDNNDTQNASTSLCLVNNVPMVAFLDAIGLSTTGIELARAQNATGSTWSTPIVLLNNNKRPDISNQALADLDGQAGLAYTLSDTDELWFRRAKDAANDEWSEPVLVDGAALTTTHSYALAEINGLPCLAYYKSGTGLVLTYATSSSGVKWNPLITLDAECAVAFVTLIELNRRPAVAYRAASGVLKFATYQP